ncbi:MULTISPECIES: hypothetical protein [Pseudomonas]|jgi:hypothetical protein|uniref:Transmembrane protein n=1 Tax=Pseudomonas fluorescens TaxID=294 RepID=A0A166QRL9_PSEFL|nr:MULTISPECIES: hypothetical protein [Pseudomonas]KZN20745.1 hypothetical protein A1D17_04160 [Pseudomonas fluorescens]
MSRKGTSIGASKLAMYAADPAGVINPKKMNKAALRYGTRAHAKIGKGPNALLYIIIAVVVLYLAFTGGIPWK